MKSFFLNILLTLVSLVSAAGLQAANTVTVSPISGDAGSEVAVTVSLANSDALAGLQILLTLPEDAGVTVDPEVTISGRAAGFSGSAGLRDGRISVMLYSLSGKPLGAGSGEILKFKVTLGDSPVNATLAAEAKGSDAAGKPVACGISPVSMLCRCPLLKIVTGSVDFGRVPLNETAERIISLQNGGTAPLVISDIVSSRPEFSILTPMPLTVAAGETATATVKFTPDERGDLQSSARILCNSTSTVNVVELAARPYAVNTLTVGSASGVSDSEVEISLSVDNMDAVNGLSLELPLPKQTEYVDGSFSPDPKRTAGHHYTASCSDGVLKVIIYSLSNSPFSGVAGPVGSFKVRLVGKNTASLIPSKAVLSAFYKGEVTDVLSDIYNGKVTVSYPSISVSSSLSLGRTPVTDQAEATLRIYNNGSASLTVSRIGLDSQNFQITTPLPLTVSSYGSADVNISCSSLEAGELTDVLKIYCNDPDMRLVNVNVTATRFFDNHLEFRVPEAVIDRQEAWINVDMSNYNPIQGLQFDVKYPAEYLSPADDVGIAARAAGFQVIRRDIAAGVARYFMFSLSGSVIEPGEGEIMRIPFALSKGTEPSQLNLTAENFTLSSEKMEDLNSQLTGVNLTLDLGLSGDLNDDGLITASDLQILVNYAVNNSEVTPRADLNDDDTISVTDIQILINKIINSK